jgi:tetratricopeptide (TPR) repeat protein
MALLLALGLGLLTGCSYFPKLTVIPDPLAKAERLSLGQAYESQGQLDLAEREYRAALPLADGYLALANLYYGRAGDRESQKKAEEYYRRALISAPSPEAANNLAWVYLQDGRWLKVAERLALRAIVEGLKANLSPEVIDVFKDTLYQIRSAQLAQYQADLAAQADAKDEPKAKDRVAATEAVAEKTPKAKDQAAATEAITEKTPKAKDQATATDAITEKTPKAEDQVAATDAIAKESPKAKDQAALAAAKAKKGP